MDIAALPRDIEQLQKMILAFHQEITLLHEKYRILQAQMFGQRSERLQTLEALGQLGLFESGETSSAAPEPKTTTVEPHKRLKKGQRKPIPEHFTRVELVHDLSEQEKVCHCGSQKTAIGEDVSEQIDIVPEKVIVYRHIRPKYACKACENVADEGPTVSIARMPKQLLPKTLATPGLLAFLVVLKYIDSMPLYRMERRFKRLDIDISRKTMSGWMVRLGEKLDVLWRMLLKEIKAAPWLGIDETSNRVHREKGRANKAKSYMWVLQARQPKPTIFFYYAPSRGGHVARDLLDGYKGTVVTDDYGGYNFLKGSPLEGREHNKGATHALCWVHVRRKYLEVVKGLPDLKALNPETITARALAAITRLYALERAADKAGYTGEQRLEMRQKETAPLLAKLKAELDDFTHKFTPTGKLSKAIYYTLRNWKELTVFIDDPLVEPDNNWTLCSGYFNPQDSVNPLRTPVSVELVA